MRTRTASITDPIEYLIQPLTEEELTAMRDEDGEAFIETIVGLDLSDIAWGSFDSFLDAISDAVCSVGMLSDISFCPVGADPNARLVLMKVSGLWDYDY